MKHRRGKKTRWTADENAALVQTFGIDMSKKRLPEGSRIKQASESVLLDRSVDRIRSKLHNIITGKEKNFFKKMVHSDKV